MNFALYDSPIACSLIPYIALTEAGAEFDVRVVDFKLFEFETQTLATLAAAG